MPQFFIERPVFAWVIAILITLAGVLAIGEMGVEAYPEIAPPSVTISASYPGADAATVERVVTAVIEQQLTGIEGLLYFSSSSTSSGGSSITLTFESGVDVDLAAVETQNRVRRAEPRLPQTVREQGINVAKAGAGFLLVVSLIADNGALDAYQLNNLISARVLDPIARVPGVGGTNLFGAEYAMRIWLDPDRLHGFGLAADEVLAAVRAQNQQFAAGSIGAMPAVAGQAITANVVGESRFSSIEAFEQVLLRTLPDGSALRLADVARVELGAQFHAFSAKLDGQPNAAFAVQLQPGANALEVADAVRARMAELEAGFPPGVRWWVPYDSSQFVSISIREVVKTLFEAVFLVFLVMLLFLQNLRATLIPMLVVPVALVGAFAGMYLLGFTINVLSMLGLVLAIGIVVDDAIIVVENIERLMREEGLSPLEASRKGMRQITAAVVAVTTVLAAVFIPSAMMTGSVGAIYQQFALAIALSMLLSAVMALSFTPALCASLLKPHSQARSRFFVAFNRGFERMTGGYLRLVAGSLRRTPRWMLGYLVIVLLAVFVLFRLPDGFLPEEDQGYAIAIVQLPPGATLQRTVAVMDEVGERLRSNPLVANVVEVAGFSFLGSGENSGIAFIRLSDWSERRRADARLPGFLRWANGELSGIRDAQVFVVNLPTIRGLGAFGGFDMRLQDRAGLGREALLAARDTLLMEAARDPALVGVRPGGLEDGPELRISVDRVQAEAMGVAVADVYRVVQLMLSSVYANDFNHEGRVLRVQLQADAEHRMRPESIGRFLVRARDGALVPLAALTQIEWGVGSPAVARYNGFSAHAISGSAAAGYSSGDAMAAMERIVRERLPAGIGLEWSGQSYQEILSGNQAPMLFVLSILVVFLCLAALYESWTIPVAVLMVVPLGLFGAVMFSLVRDLPNDIFFKVGMIAVIGLSAKNAILIIEFANRLRMQGRPLLEATVEACRMRLRPVLMTSIAFVCGVIPLAISSGAGANSRRAIGTGVMGGMVGATVLGLLLIPVFYAVVRRLLGDRS
jgi:multidrug efflux pump